MLELACGTGSILAHLRDDYAVTGLDLSPEMLAVAREKVPGVPLVEADMTAFELDERFDVVLCVYDSINHLLEFGEWEAVFARAREHLHDRGILIFDVNTERRLAAMCGYPAAVEWFGDGNLLVLNVEPTTTNGVVRWDIRVFERAADGTYRLRAEGIDETSFPRERIVESLRERFRRVSVYDRRRQRPSPRSERLYFVAVA